MCTCSWFSRNLFRITATPSTTRWVYCDCVQLCWILLIPLTLSRCSCARKSIIMLLLTCHCKCALEWHLFLCRVWSLPYRPPVFCAVLIVIPQWQIFVFDILLHLAFVLDPLHHLWAIYYLVCWCAPPLWRHCEDKIAKLSTWSQSL